MDDEMKMLFAILAETRKERDTLAERLKTANADIDMYTRWWHCSEANVKDLKDQLAKALAERDPFLPDAKEATK